MIIHFIIGYALLGTFAFLVILNKYLLPDEQFRLLPRKEQRVYKFRELIVKVIRDWFKPTINSVPWYKEIWLAFNQFEYDYIEILKNEGYDPNDIYALTFSDIIENMKAWIENYKKDSST